MNQLKPIGAGLALAPGEDESIMIDRSIARCARYGPPSLMNRYRSLIHACLFVATALPPAAAGEVEHRAPVFKQEHILLAPADLTDWRYLAFPALLDLGDEVLVSYKRARAHGSDPGASIEMFRLDGGTGKVSGRQTIAQRADDIMQMGEWVRFPNGDIANYIDVQRAGTLGRLPMSFVRSTDGGRTFGPLQRVGVIDGVEYGYPFESVSEGSTTWLLVMTFTSLAGGKSVYAPRPYAGSVDVIRSEDNGQTWKFVRNLSKEFGDIPINESTFMRHADGFLVSTRGYDNCERLHFTDHNFALRRQVDLTAMYPFIASYLGRPRLFGRDGAVYLLGRNWTKSSPPPGWKPAAGKPVEAEPKNIWGVPLFGARQLCLFRLDPGALAVTSYSILDNAESANVTDGYYAVPYFRQVDGKTRLNVITYKGKDRQPPQIIRLEFLWDEVR